ncbi:hemicentin-2-like [Dermacentor silvarum]|uniref:hemicentin-2-like n=1 Tax=Dermacentor silvarum TaxID=543639 RepID=UPI002100CA09|nr:hemicentin-2-like [Dermacentor silvarum]
MAPNAATRTRLPPDSSCAMVTCGAKFGDSWKHRGLGILGTMSRSLNESAAKPRVTWITLTRDCLWPVALICTLLLVACPADVEAASNAPFEVTAVAGGDAWLPCNITPDGNEERPVALILWYKDNSSTPVYTVDARWGSLLQGARHFPSEEDEELAARMSFEAGHQPALLRVTRVQAEDAGIYRCRVDYRQARTEVTFSVLRVIVPPRELIVLDEYGQRQVDVLGPYNEGATVLLVCEVEGGDPPPEVVWYKDGELLDASFSVLWPQGVVRNELRLGPLRRRDLLVALQCTASNNNLTEELTALLKLDLTLKPTEVKVSLPTLSTPSGGATLVAGEVAEARCQARGARPVAQVAWFKGGERLQHDRLLSREPGLTLSAVSFVVRAQDHGLQLTCRADNPSLPGSEISDSFVLDVQYPPQLSLTASDLRPHEGDNSTLRCDWSANPTVNAVWWRRDGQLLEWRDEVLHLSNVTRAHSGLYECLASNRFGESFSNQLRLSVQYAPECAEGQREEYAASPELRVACEVRANPSDELHFEWLANTTKRAGRINSLAVNGTRALARAVASRELEYGLLLCWASNNVGKQRDPCIFRIVPPAPPGSPHNCTVTAQSQDGMAVTCSPGSTGGLPVTFFAELLVDGTATSPPALLRNASDSGRPEFSFAGLPKEGSLLVRVYAANSQGRSADAEVHLPAGLSLLHKPSPPIDSNAVKLPGHVLGFLVTAVVALVFVIVSLTAARHWKRRRRRKEAKHSVQLQKYSPEKTFCECTSGDVVYQSPDLITSKYGVSGEYTRFDVDS